MTRQLLPPCVRVYTHTHTHTHTCVYYMHIYRDWGSMTRQLLPPCVRVYTHTHTHTHTCVYYMHIYRDWGSMTRQLLPPTDANVRTVNGIGFYSLCIGIGLFRHFGVVFAILALGGAGTRCMSPLQWRRRRARSRERRSRRRSRKVYFKDR